MKNAVGCQIHTGGIYIHASSKRRGRGVDDLADAIGDQPGIDIADYVVKLITVVSQNCAGLRGHVCYLYAIAHASPGAFLSTWYFMADARSLLLQFRVTAQYMQWSRR